MSKIACLIVPIVFNITNIMVGEISRTNKETNNFDLRISEETWDKKKTSIELF